MDKFDDFTQELLEHNRKELADQTEQISGTDFLYQGALSSLKDMIGEPDGVQSDLEEEIRRRMALPENEGRSEISIRREILAEENAMFMTKLYNTVNGESAAEAVPCEENDEDSVEYTEDGRILLDLEGYIKNDD
ncbi:MAG: hypothetical protein IKD81_08285 [Eubacteriaceae bacterium]|nr:hypothetical protein [Eubacteriaceae bacterium]